MKALELLLILLLIIKWSYHNMQCRFHSKLPFLRAPRPRTLLWLRVSVNFWPPAKKSVCNKKNQNYTVYTHTNSHAHYKSNGNNIMCRVMGWRPQKSQTNWLLLLLLLWRCSISHIYKYMSYLLFNSSNCTHGGIPIELSHSLELMIKEKMAGRKRELATGG